jgi:exo-beta-1,3-glucanase (GH17 family)
MTYTPYTSNGACKNAPTVASDVASIASKGFTSIRLYSTDCDGLEKIVPVASSHSMKVVLGIFIDQRGISPASEQIGDIMDYFKGNYESVEMVVVGNEAIFSEYCSASELAAFISSVKTTLQSAGYTGPVTTTEPMHVIAENAAILCPVIDVIGANIHGFFHSDISAADAGFFVATSLAELESYCPGNKEAWNLETGWPSSGTANGKAIPGALEQEIAIMGIVKSAGSRSAIFSFEDDLWKNEGDFEVETSWGCAQLFEVK